MISEIKRISDLEPVIDATNRIIAEYNSLDCDNLKLQKEMILVSQPIIDSKLNSSENKKNYSSLSVSVIERVKQNKHTHADIEKWESLIKQNIAFMFVMMSNEAYNNGILFPDGDDELDEKLLNFFVGDEVPIIAANFFAARRFARKDPMLCYKQILADYERVPDLLKRIYNELSYIYDRENVKDDIINNCPICQNDKSDPFFCANQAMTERRGFSPAKLWMKCRHCGNLFAYNFPTIKVGEINGHYTKKNEDGILSPRMLLSVYCDIFNGVKQFNAGNRYLEVGVGNGEMLAVALEMGYDVSAVEICKEDCENISGALGVDIVWSDFLKYNTEKRFDLIVMGDILEHVTEPVTALKKAYELLDSAGILWLSTPNYNSAFTRMRKFTDPMWNQPNHFTYFSFEGLAPFLDEIGFDVKKYEVSRRYNGSMELILQKRNK